MNIDCYEKERRWIGFYSMNILCRILYVLRAVAITIRNISTASSWFVHSIFTRLTPLFWMFLIGSMFRFERRWIANSCFKKSHITQLIVFDVWWIIVNGGARNARLRYRFPHTTNTPWFFNNEKNTYADRRAASSLYNRFNLGILVN